MGNSHSKNFFDIKIIDKPLLVFNSDGIVIDKNDKVREFMEMEEIPDNFLLTNDENCKVAVAYIKAVIRDKEYRKPSFFPDFFNSKHIERFKNMYFVSSCFKKDLCLVEIKKISEYNKIGLECIRLINYEESLNKSISILSKQDRSSPFKGLQNILKTFNASRIYINKNFRNEDGDYCTQCIEEACASGVSSIKDNPEVNLIRYKHGFIRWILELSEGSILSGYLKNFPQNESAYLSSRNIIYILVIPIFVDKKWFGFLGLDFCYNDIKISALDIQTLRRLAEQFASYYSLSQYNQKIYDFNDKLLKNLEFKNKMTSLLNHDIKNPLNGIMGFSDLLINDSKYFSKEKLIDYIQLINKSASSLGVVVDDISYWIKTVQSDTNYHLNSDIKPVFIKEIIDKSFSLLKIMASKKSITLLNKIRDDFSLNTDFNMMFTVFRNIIINAIKFTPERGTVSVYCKKDIKIKNNVVICIEDTGVGMSKERIDQILKESKVVSKKGTNGESGLGLGIQFSKRFITLLNGEMRIESTEGCGTTFLISLPENK